MKLFLVVLLLLATALLLSLGVRGHTSKLPSETHGAYLGFDSNIYPGDVALPVLRKTFAFTSYWLSPPPLEKINTWLGKRELVRSQGFGFLVLYRGRASSELKKPEDAGRTGGQDASSAAGAAKREGFPANTIVFLDIEEGGRLSPAYHSYIQGWLATLTALGYQGGFYCSGIPWKEDAHTIITTADDISSDLRPKSRAFSIWAYNDTCPPSLGCSFPQNPPPPSESGIGYATVWQFAQSPRRKEVTSKCAATYHRDGNCYAPGDTAQAWMLDVNSANSQDPSHGAR